jgi:hypothetical protein
MNEQDYHGFSGLILLIISLTIYLPLLMIISFMGLFEGTWITLVVLPSLLIGLLFALYHFWKV